MEAGRIGGCEKKEQPWRQARKTNPLSRFPKGRPGRAGSPHAAKARLPPQEGQPPCAIPQARRSRIVLDTDRPSHGSRARQQAVVEKSGTLRGRIRIAAVSGPQACPPISSSQLWGSILPTARDERIGFEWQTTKALPGSNRSCDYPLLSCSGLHSWVQPRPFRCSVSSAPSLRAIWRWLI